MPCPTVTGSNTGSIRQPVFTRTCGTLMEALSTWPLCPERQSRDGGGGGCPQGSQRGWSWGRVVMRIWLGYRAGPVGGRFISGPAFCSKSSMQLFCPRPRDGVHLDFAGWRAVLMTTSVLSVTSGASSLHVGLPASLQLTQNGDSEHSRMCLPHPGFSQLVLELWLDQKWQLCHHSRA